MQVSISEFADKLMEIMPVLSREFLKKQPGEFAKCKITLPQLVILSFLKKHEQAKMSDIAHYMNVTTAAMTGIVDRLVRDGDVTRIYDPDDRRIIKINLTPKGSKLIEKTHEQKKQMIVHLFSRVSQKDREDYLRVLTNMRDILANEEEA